MRPATLTAILSLTTIGALAAAPVLADNHAAPQTPGAMDVARVTAGTYATDPAHTLVGWRVVARHGTPFGRRVEVHG